MALRILMAAGLIVLCGFANAQSVLRCEGDFPKFFREGPYSFMVNAHVERRLNFNFTVTCVETFARGLFRFNWHVPSHRVDLDSPDYHARRKPVSVEAGLTPSLGCLSYGNLKNSDRSEFYADQLQLPFLDFERQNGCPKSVSSVLPRYAQAHSKNTIPEHVRYEEEAIFLGGEAEREKGLTRVSVSINFDANRSGAYLTLSYSSKSPTGAAPVSERGFFLRPIGEQSHDQIFLAAYREQIGNEYRLKEQDKLTIRFSLNENSRFGSTELGILNSSKTLLTSFWVPVLFNEAK